MIVGIISIVLAVAGIILSIYKPPRKKLAWTIAVCCIGLIAIIYLFFEQRQTQSRLLTKRFSLEPRYNEVVELPTAATDIRYKDENILIPFRVDIGEDPVTIRMYVDGRDITRELPTNIALQEKSKYRETTDGGLILYPGTIFFNIPFKIQSIISNEGLDVVVDLIQRGEEKDTVRISYEVDLNSWEFAVNFSKHNLWPDESVRLALTIKNHGSKGKFRVFSKLRKEGEERTDAPFLKDGVEFDVDRNEEYTLQEDVRFGPAGVYIVDFAVVKQAEYLELEFNEMWRQARKWKSFYFSVEEDDSGHALPAQPISNSHRFGQPQDLTFAFTRTLDLHAQEYGVQVYDLIYWNHELIRSPEKIPRGAVFRVPANRPKPPYTWLYSRVPIYDEIDGQVIKYFEKRHNIFILDQRGGWYKVLSADGGYLIGWTRGKHWQ